MTRQEELFERFVAFHRAHPEVWRYFDRYALDARASGQERYGASEIVGRIRWHVRVERRGAEPFKVNDHVSPFYARLWMLAHPEAGAFFELREQKSRLRRARHDKPGARAVQESLLELQDDPLLRRLVELLEEIRTTPPQRSDTAPAPPEERA